MILSLSSRSLSTATDSIDIAGTSLNPKLSGVQATSVAQITRVITFVVYMMRLPSIETIWSVSDHNFNAIALKVFQYQAKNNLVYAEYLQLIDKQPEKIKHFTQIPFLPISLFKTHKIITGTFKSERTFESSSTTGAGISHHYVKNLADYHTNALHIMAESVGDISQYEIVGLLPNYLERSNSSLVEMVTYFMRLNGQKDSFYLYNHADLYDRITKSNKPILLFGVSFALLDFAADYTIDMPITIIETGGMKGRKKEMTKDEVYAELRASFPSATIRSEYGMTELLSQAYSDEHMKYTTPPWMKVLPREDTDPLTHKYTGRSAALNIIDLANLHTCSFIATDDIGSIHEDGTFEVKGRLDQADIRGCSLMVV